ncbi:hypothetical protein FGO68_gene2680 [Halteria grandinella]|uniref:Uncharacterized protein n=1 Tax=Halteria grandinella TaxID=5974 RepID=A0A8J8NE60_HALGN|nr:hypothetical protein FGO68_gene2680 [Halteria grandinella]
MMFTYQNLKACGNTILKLNSLQILKTPSNDRIRSAFEKYYLLIELLDYQVIIDNLSDASEIDAKFISHKIPSKQLILNIKLNDQRFFDRYSILQKLSQAGLRHVQNIICETNIDFKLQKLKMYAKNMNINQYKSSDQVLYLEILTSIQISEHFCLEFGRTLKIIQSRELAICPTKISIISNDLGGRWISLMVEVLKGFCNQENAIQLGLHNSCGIEVTQFVILDSLYLTVKQYVNLRHLTIPMGWGQDDIENILDMLSVQIHLINLTLNSISSNHGEQAVQRISKFAIDQMRELRTLRFVLLKNILLKGVKYYERAAPLTIFVDIYQEFTQYIIEPSIGKKRYYQMPEFEQNEDNEDYDLIKI